MQSWEKKHYNFVQLSERLTDLRTTEGTLETPQTSQHHRIEELKETLDCAPRESGESRTADAVFPAGHSAAE